MNGDDPRNPSAANGEVIPDLEGPPARSKQAEAVFDKPYPGHYIGVGTNRPCKSR
ncbi:MAG: hypothetical protein MZU79_04130 [Anaerotruncus sp.]|nr:hypothetical protein [Anaerotruncus sp.]